MSTCVKRREVEEQEQRKSEAKRQVLLRGIQEAARLAEVEEERRRISANHRRHCQSHLESEPVTSKEFTLNLVNMTPIPSTSPVVHSDPDILGGTLVFVGTRVPVRTLLDYLEAGDSLNEFLEHFPSVSRGQAIAVLELAKEMLTTYANSA